MYCKYKIDRRCEKVEQEELQRLSAQVEALKAAIIKAPCRQNRIPCQWPCDNDASERGPCWKQLALREGE